MSSCVRSPFRWACIAVLLAFALVLATHTVATASPLPPHPAPHYADFDAPPGATQLHVVQFGQTLKSIAAWYGADLGEVIAINNLSNPDWIYPGTELIIPLYAAASEAAPEPQAPQQQQPAAPDPYSLAPTVANITAYISQVFAPLGANAQAWALRVAKCESNYNPWAVNRRGNWHGLFQYHPHTWAEFSNGDIYDWVAQTQVTARLYAAGQTWRWACK